MRISHIRPVLFNFLNGTGMKIILNKQGGIGMGVTHPEPTLLPSLGEGSGLGGLGCLES